MEGHEVLPGASSPTPSFGEEISPSAQHRHNQPRDTDLDGCGGAAGGAAAPMYSDDDDDYSDEYENEVYDEDFDDDNYGDDTKTTTSPLPNLLSARSAGGAASSDPSKKPPRYEQTSPRRNVPTGASPSSPPQSRLGGRPPSSSSLGLLSNNNNNASTTNNNIFLAGGQLPQRIMSPPAAGVGRNNLLNSRPITPSAAIGGDVGAAGGGRSSAYSSPPSTAAGVVGGVNGRLHRLQSPMTGGGINTCMMGSGLYSLPQSRRGIALDADAAAHGGRIHQQQQQVIGNASTSSPAGRGDDEAPSSNTNASAADADAVDDPSRTVRSPTARAASIVPLPLSPFHRPSVARYTKEKTDDNGGDGADDDDSNNHSKNALVLGSPGREGEAERGSGNPNSNSDQKVGNGNKNGNSHSTSNASAASSSELPSFRQRMLAMQSAKERKLKEEQEAALLLLHRQQHNNTSMTESDGDGGGAFGHTSVVPDGGGGPASARNSNTNGNSLSLSASAPSASGNNANNESSNNNHDDGSTAIAPLVADEKREGDATLPLQPPPPRAFTPTVVRERFTYGASLKQKMLMVKARLEEERRYNAAMLQSLKESKTTERREEDDEGLRKSSTLVKRSHTSLDDYYQYGSQRGAATAPSVDAYKMRSATPQPVRLMTTSGSGGVVVSGDRRETPKFPRRYTRSPYEENLVGPSSSFSSSSPPPTAAAAVTSSSKTLVNNGVPSSSRGILKRKVSTTSTMDRPRDVDGDDEEGMTDGGGEFKRVDTANTIINGGNNNCTGDSVQSLSAAVPLSSSGGAARAAILSGSGTQRAGSKRGLLAPISSGANSPRVSTTAAAGNGSGGQNNSASTSTGRLLPSLSLQHPHHPNQLLPRQQTPNTTPIPVPRIMDAFLKSAGGQKTVVNAGARTMEKQRYGGGADVSNEDSLLLMMSPGRAHLDTARGGGRCADAATATASGSSTPHHLKGGGSAAARDDEPTGVSNTTSPNHHLSATASTSRVLGAVRTVPPLRALDLKPTQQQQTHQQQKAPFDVSHALLQLDLGAGRHTLYGYDSKSDPHLQHYFAEKKRKAAAARAERERKRNHTSTTTVGRSTRSSRSGRLPQLRSPTAHTLRSSKSRTASRDAAGSSSDDDDNDDTTTPPDHTATPNGLLQHTVSLAVGALNKAPIRPNEIVSMRNLLYPYGRVKAPAELTNLLRCVDLSWLTERIARNEERRKGDASTSFLLSRGDGRPSRRNHIGSGGGGSPARSPSSSHHRRRSPSPMTSRSSRKGTVSSRADEPSAGRVGDNSSSPSAATELPAERKGDASRNLNSLNIGLLANDDGRYGTVGTVDFTTALINSPRSCWVLVRNGIDVYTLLDRPETFYARRSDNIDPLTLKGRKAMADAVRDAVLEDLREQYNVVCGSLFNSVDAAVAAIVGTQVGTIISRDWSHYSSGGGGASSPGTSRKHATLVNGKYNESPLALAADDHESSQPIEGVLSDGGGASSSTASSPRRRPKSRQTNDFLSPDTDDDEDLATVKIAAAKKRRVYDNLVQMREIAAKKALKTHTDAANREAKRREFLRERAERQEAIARSKRDRVEMMAAESHAKKVREYERLEEKHAERTEQLEAYNRRLAEERRMKQEEEQRRADRSRCAKEAVEAVKIEQLERQREEKMLRAQRRQETDAERKEMARLEQEEKEAKRTEIRRLAAERAKANADRAEQKLSEAAKRFEECKAEIQQQRDEKRAISQARQRHVEATTHKGITDRAERAEFLRQREERLKNEFAQNAAQNSRERLASRESKQFDKKQRNLQTDSKRKQEWFASLCEATRTADRFAIFEAQQKEREAKVKRVRDVRVKVKVASDDMERFELERLQHIEKQQDLANYLLWNPKYDPRLGN